VECVQSADGTGLEDFLQVPRFGIAEGTHGTRLSRE